MHYNIMPFDMCMVIIILFFFSNVVLFTFGYYSIKKYQTNRSLKLSKELFALYVKLNQVTKESKTLDIDQNLSLRLTDNSRRSLVLMFGWLGSKEKHLEHYKKLYLNKGYDVLGVR